MLRPTTRRKMPSVAPHGSSCWRIRKSYFFAAFALFWIIMVVAFVGRLRGSADAQGEPVGNSVSKANDEDAFVPPTLFLSIASYRDDECHNTILDAYKRAAWPDKLYVGAFQQHSENDTDCYWFAQTCEEEPSHPICPHLDRISVTRIHWMDAKGPVYGRHHAELLAGDQEMYLQIDAHSEFIENWDKVFYEMWQATDNEYAVISSYPKNLNARSTKQSKMICVICETGWDKASFHMVKHKSCRLGKLPKGQEHKPLLTTFWGAGMSYSKMHRVQRVPYDAYLPMLFDGEEFSIGARMWTHGYDFYAPNIDCIFHQYGPNKSGKRRDKFWDHDWTERSRIMGRSAGRVNYLFGLKHWVDMKVVNLTDLDTKYGFGDKRTVEQYLEWVHVDLNKQTAPSNCPKVLAGELKRVQWNSNDAGDG